MGDAPSLLLVAFGVGIVIGLTGMGGGALMTPALIFLGIPPTTAVANDLVAASVNKSVGAAVHWRSGSPNLHLVKWLLIGSVPFAFAGAWIVRALGSDAEQQSFLTLAIGVTLVLTAATFVIRMYLELSRGILDDPDAPDPEVRPLPTLLVGAVGGLLVGITSVGSGSLIMVSLVLLYPALSAKRLVGTDLVQAIPLVIAASVSHVLVSGIDWAVLLPLVLGGSPGTYLGARLANIVPQSVTRRGIAIVLTLTGLAMLGVDPVWVGLIGGALVILGPVGWGILRRAHGVPAFDHLPGRLRRDTATSNEKG
ncbi:sulfite exporter TauE/SafE family protein [Janibacter sp. GS2]|uniref:sulfite exporter TauE/SafE family protein n=1 Tax=Janibacter sp. GS2 TaxID=3442646 RepID=UPI003EB9FFD5